MLEHLINGTQMIEMPQTPKNPAVTQLIVVVSSNR